MVTTDLQTDRIDDVDRKRLMDRLARVEGQLRGIQKMIARDEDCESIAQQMAAARGALDKAFAELVACAVERRLSQTTLAGADLRQQITDAVSLLTKYG